MAKTERSFGRTGQGGFRNCGKRQEEIQETKRENKESAQKKAENLESFQNQPFALQFPSLLFILVCLLQLLERNTAYIVATLSTISYF